MITNKWYPEVTAQVNELSSVLPAQIFDFHAHIQLVPDSKGQMPEFWDNGPASVSIKDWQEDFSKIFPGKELSGGLFFPGTFPFADSRTSNDSLIRQLEENPSCKGLILVTPSDTAEDIIAWLKHPQVAGLKPYYMFSTEQPVLQSSIKGFFPEWMWTIANDFKSVIMMHLVRDKAVSDPLNIEQIKEMCSGYPDLKLILAHVARSFHAPNVKGIDELSGLDNIWFDMSAICESEPIHYMIRKFGADRLLWGSDYPLSHLRARAVTISDGFIWLDDTTCNWDMSPFGKPAFLTIESLRALRTVIEQLGLSKKDIHDIFYGNASRLLQL